MARVIGAVTRNTNYEVSVKKPLDARSIVKTYADLTDRNNWINEAGNPIVYNGMLVAVWLNSEDPSKNGVYFLQDASVTKATQTPDVTKEENWHKLSDSAESLDFITAEELAAFLESYAKTGDVVTTTAFEAYISNNNVAVQSLETRVGTAKADDAAATGLFARVDAVADEVADLITSTTANTAKLDGIATTVTQAIDQAIEAAILTIPKLDVATTDNLGGIKSGTGENIVSVDATGIASVNSISVSSLSQTDDELLILRGGDTLTNV
jgi:hypothetical protein